MAFLTEFYEKTNKRNSTSPQQRSGGILGALVKANGSDEENGQSPVRILDSLTKLYKAMERRISAQNPGRNVQRGTGQSSEYTSRTAAVRNSEDIQREQDQRTWFQKGAFEDGYQPGDITKAILGTTADIQANLGAGVLGIGEKALDTTATVGPYLLEKLIQGTYGDPVLQGSEKLSQMFVSLLMGKDPNYIQDQRDELAAQVLSALKPGAEAFVKNDLYDEREVAQWLIDHNTLGGFINEWVGVDTESDSVFGEKIDAIVQSAGELAAQYGLEQVGVPWYVTTGVTSFGSEAESALQQGATLDEAALSAAIAAGAEILTEKLFGGDLFVKKAGLDDLVDKLTEGISQKFVQALARGGLQTIGEGVEEWITTRIGQFGQWVAYRYDELGLFELLYSEDALEEAIDSFLGGIFLGGPMNAIKAATSGSKPNDGKSSPTLEDANAQQPQPVAVDTDVQKQDTRTTGTEGNLHGEGENGYSDDRGSSPGGDAQRRAQGSSDGGKSGGMLSQQGNSQGTGESAVYDPTEINHSDGKSAPQTSREALAWVLENRELQKIDPRTRTSLQEYGRHLQQLQTIERLQSQLQPTSTDANTSQLAQRNVAKLEQLYARHEQRLTELEKNPRLQRLAQQTLTDHAPTESKNVENSQNADVDNIRTYDRIKNDEIHSETETDGVVEIELSRTRYPQSAQHILDAVAAGKAEILTIDREHAQENRRRALAGMEKSSEYDLDEYPPAMFKEGGEGASVRQILPSDNRGAGAVIGHQLRGYPDGTKIKIKIVD